MSPAITGAFHQFGELVAELLEIPPIGYVLAAAALFHPTALVVVASITAHSSTDVVVARRFEPGPG